MKENSSILVTGGAGFIGSHLTDYLLNQGHNVVVLDDLSGGFIENVECYFSSKEASGVKKDALFVQGSILDHQLLDQLFQKYSFNYVYHLAAYAAEGLSHFIKRFNYLNNLVGSVNLINASVNYGVECFVFTSSMAVYGSAQVPMTEDMLPAPEDSYGIAKAAVERELAISKELFGLNYVIFRPHNVFGPRQNIGDRYRNVAGIFMNQILRNAPVTIFGDGEQVRAFSYIDDIVPVIAQSPTFLKAIGQIFNIGGDTPCTINELASLVTKHMQVPQQIVHLEPRHEVKFAYCNHDKAMRVFGYAPSTSLETGIEKMVAWAKRRGAQQCKQFTEIEIEKNLPGFWRRS